MTFTSRLVDTVDDLEVACVGEIGCEDLTLLRRVIHSVHTYEYCVALAGRIDEVLMHGKAYDVLNLRHIINSIDGGFTVHSRCPSTLYNCLSVDS